MKRPPKKVTMDDARKAHHIRWPRLSHGTSMVTGMMSASILGSWTAAEEEEEEEEEDDEEEDDEEGSRQGKEGDHGGPEGPPAPLIPSPALEKPPKHRPTTLHLTKLGAQVSPRPRRPGSPAPARERGPSSAPLSGARPSGLAQQQRRLRAGPAAALVRDGAVHARPGPAPR